MGSEMCIRDSSPRNYDPASFPIAALTVNGDAIVETIVLARRNEKKPHKSVP